MRIGVNTWHFVKIAEMNSLKTQNFAKSAERRQYKPKKNLQESEKPFLMAKFISARVVEFPWNRL